MRTQRVALGPAMFLLIGSLLLSSCDEAKQEQRKPPPNPLSEVSPALAIHVEMVKLDLQVCEVAIQALAATTHQAKQDSDLTRDVHANESAICAVLKRVALNNGAIAASIIATKSIPAELFYFYEVKEGRDEKLINRAIGLFTSLSECEAAEQIYRHVDTPTRPCRKWDGTGFVG